MDHVQGDSMDNKIYVNGRHMGPKPLRRKNIYSNISFEEGVGATIRLDDKENPEWWLEIHLTKEQLEEMLKEIA